ncbi:MAG: hypothetical protein MUE48_04335 [Desulfobacterales bacterium]|nr:hypothetical protein [Desulfobacterales bacterium]
MIDTYFLATIRVLDRHVLLGDDQEQDGHDHHDGRDDDAHLEEPPVDELHDVEVGLRGEQVVDPHHERGGEIREGPDEDQQRPRDVARGGEREGDVPELAQPPGAHALRRLVERGGDLAHGVHDGERHEREEVQGLDQQHPLDAVHEVDGFLEAEVVHQQDVDRPGPAEDEDEAHDPDQRRHDHRHDRQIREQPAARELVAQQQEGEGDADDRGGDDRSHPQQHGVQ